LEEHNNLPPEVNTDTPTLPEISELSRFFDRPPSQLVLCSSNKCRNGHTWPPSLTLAKCPGCQAPVLARRMENCPICNEPIHIFQMRTDNISKQMGLLPMCKGAESKGEIGTITIECQHAADYENADPVSK
jgi:hypothetical protein